MHCRPMMKIYNDKHAKKELGLYPAILTSHLVNGPYMLAKGFITWNKERNGYCTGLGFEKVL